MNNNIFEGKWKQLRGQAKVLWGKLTDDDLEKIGGNYDKLVGTLQEKYGYTQQQAEDEVKKRTS
ncbi:MAG: CsbD family protein [Anaerolineaceae bacterium]|nr:CsbD family protein [Anaerolineaceae bacterium]